MQKIIFLTLLVIISYSQSSPEASLCYCEKGKTFNLTTGECIDITIPNCIKQEESSDNDCDGCKPGFSEADTNNGDKCTVNPATGTTNYIPNCAYYEDCTETGCPKKCDDCETGYYEKGNNECVKIPVSGDADYIENCKVYKDFGSLECYICNDNYYRISSKLKCVAGIENCIDQNNQNCYECKSTHYPASNNSKCSPISSTVQNCLKYKEKSSGTSQCERCKNNYYPATDGTCKEVDNDKKDENCLYFYSSTNCSMCKPPYNKDDNTGKCLIPATTDPYYDANCRQYQSYSGTLKCYECIKDENNNYSYWKTATGKCEKKCPAYTLDDTGNGNKSNNPTVNAQIKSFIYILLGILMICII